MPQREPTSNKVGFEIVRKYKKKVKNDTSANKEVISLITDRRRLYSSQKNEIEKKVLYTSTLFVCTSKKA